MYTFQIIIKLDIVKLTLFKIIVTNVYISQFVIQVMENVLAYQGGVVYIASQVRMILD